MFPVVKNSARPSGENRIGHETVKAARANDERPHYDLIKYITIRDKDTYNITPSTDLTPH